MGTSAKIVPACVLQGPRALTVRSPMQDIMVMAPRLIKLSLYTLSLDLGYVWEGKNDVIDIITTIIIIIVATESENSGD